MIDLARRVLDLRQEPSQKSRRLGERLVHLPVGRDHRRPIAHRSPPSPLAGSSASTPGSALPSISSSDAPPPVESQSTPSGEAELDERGSGVAAADDASSRRSPRRPRRRAGSRRRTARARRRPSGRSRRPSRPPRSTRRRRRRCAGPTSRPIIPSGTSTPSRWCGSASAEKLSPITRSVGRRSSQSERSRPLERLARQLDPLLLDQRVARLVALGAEEAEAHRAADQDLVGELEEALDHADLVGHLRPAEHDHERPVGIVEDGGELTQLALEQQPGVGGQVAGRRPRWRRGRGGRRRRRR